MSPSRRQIVVNIILVILVFNVGVLGYRLTRAPIELVDVTLNKIAISSGEELTMTIHNYGFKWISFGSDSDIYRVYDNGTIQKFRYPENVAWDLILHKIVPLIGSGKERVYTRLEPGNYFVKRDFKIQGYGHYYKIASFTVR